MFLLWLRQLPRRGDWIPALVPPPTEGRSHPTNTPVSPPSSFVLPSFAWFSIFFSGGQVLLSTFSWCSASTSVSEGVFLMHLWREMYSTSTYSSAILFPIVFSFPLHLCILSHIFLASFFLFLTFIPEYFMSICVVVFLITFSNWLLLMYQRAIAYWFC